MTKDDGKRNDGRYIPWERKRLGEWKKLGGDVAWWKGIVKILLVGGTMIGQFKTVDGVTNSMKWPKGSSDSK